MNAIIAKLLNEQINKEFYSAYLYLSIANYYDGLDLDGYANYYRIQAQEERDHALLFLTYMQNNSLDIVFKAIEKPEQEFDSILW
jgi:ferritin